MKIIVIKKLASLLIILLLISSCNNVEHVNQDNTKKSKNPSSEKSEFISKVFEQPDRHYSRFQYYDFLAPRCHKLPQIKTTKLEEVQILEINKVSLDEFFEIENQLINLEALMVVYTQIDEANFERLIKALENKKHFIKLILNHNGLTEIPTSISRLTKLITLDLSFQDFKTLPDEITQFPNLSYLRVAKNRSLTELPENIGNLSDLEILEFAGTNVSILPKSIGLLSNLENITGNACQIKSIPNEIGQLRKLKSINLGYNKIKDIPSQFGNLLELEYLSLGDNDISRIPDELRNLKKLKICGLSGNKLTYFPTEILSSKKMETLKLHRNSISNIPKELSELVELKLFYIDKDDIKEDDLKFLQTEIPDLDIRLK